MTTEPYQDVGGTDSKQFASLRVDDTVEFNHNGHVTRGFVEENSEDGPIEISGFDEIRITTHDRDGVTLVRRAFTPASNTDDGCETTTVATQTDDAETTEQATLTESAPAVSPGDRVSYQGITWTAQAVRDTRVVLDSHVDGQDRQLVSLRDIDSLTCTACGVGDIRVFERLCDDCQPNTSGATIDDGDDGIPLCECGADLSETGNLDTAEGTGPGLRNPQPVPVPDVICDWCGMSVSAAYGSEVAVDIWEAFDAPLPLNGDRFDTEKRAENALRDGEQMRIDDFGVRLVTDGGQDVDPSPGDRVEYRGEPWTLIQFSTDRDHAHLDPLSDSARGMCPQAPFEIRDSIGDYVTAIAPVGKITVVEARSDDGHGYKLPSGDRLVTDGGSDIPDDVAMPGDNKNGTDTDGDDEDDEDVEDDDGDGGNLTAELSAKFSDHMNTIREADGIEEPVQAALQAASDFAEIEVRAEYGNNLADENSINTQAEAFLNNLCDAKRDIPRRTVKSSWEAELKKQKKKEAIKSGEKTTFYQVLKNTLTRVIKRRTTDHDGSGTSYEFHFDNGLTLTVPQGTAMDEQKLWERYTSQADNTYPILSTDDEFDTDDKSWSNKMGSIIEEIGEESVTEQGPRTGALDGLRNHIRTTTGYTSLEEAVSHGGVWVIGGEPPEHDEIAVLNTDVNSVTSRHEITPRALQEEIAARDLDGDTPAGDKVSKSHTVSYQKQTLWYLDGNEFDEVGSFDPDGDDPTDRMPDRSADTTADTDDDENEQPGRMGTYGPSGDDPTDRMPDRGADTDDDENDADTDTEGDAE